MKRFSKTDVNQMSAISKSTRFGGALKNVYKRRKKELTADEALDVLAKQALEKFDPEKIPPTYMYVCISGIIQSGQVKDSTFVKMKYEMVSGDNWELVDGNIEGKSQGGCVNQNRDNNIVFNLSFNAMYRTLDIFGWPRLIMKFEGPDASGNWIIMGYGNCSIPITPGSHDIYCHIYRPIRPSFLGLRYGSQVVEEGEEVDAKVIASGKNREVTTVEHMGTIRVTVSVSHKNFRKFGVMV